MSQIDKLIQKFSASPKSLRYADIKKILIYLDFDEVQAKGSHVKWKHRALQNDIVLPIHNRDCKEFYKKQLQKQLSEFLKQ